MSLVDNLQSIGTDSNRKTKTQIAKTMGGFLLVLGVLALAMVGTGAAATEDFGEWNVTKESSDDPLEIEVVGADDMGDNTTSADATVTWYNATEYQNDSSTATTVHTATITVDEGQTVSQSYDRGDISALEYGTEYSVVASGDNSTISDAARVDGLLGGAAGSSVDGSPGFGVGVAIVALAGAGVAAARRD